jgi:hypothetical protein
LVLWSFGPGNCDIRNNFHLYHHKERVPEDESTDSDLNSYDMIVPVLEDELPSGKLIDVALYPPLNAPKLFTISMIVSNPKKSPEAGDLITAKEMVSALNSLYPETFDFQYLYQGEEWYNTKKLQQTDLLFVLLDTYDLGKALHIVDKEEEKYGYAQLPTKSVKKNIVCIAWARNWFQRWLSRPFIGQYDMILVSSFTAQRIFNQISSTIGLATQCLHQCPRGYSELSTSYRSHVKTEILLLGSNTSLFNCTTNAGTKYIIPVSYHKQHRDIMFVEPKALLPFEGKVIGKGWDIVINANSSIMPSTSTGISSNFLKLWKGFVSYEDLPKEYEQSGVIIDDANHVTKYWGSVNSRVWDALACGRLVITNGILGSNQCFNSLLPSWNSSVPTSSNSNLNKTLFSFFEYNTSHEVPTIIPNKDYFSLVNHLQKEVRTKHSYQIRAQQFAETIAKFGVVFNSTLKRKSSISQRKNSNLQICIGIRTMPSKYQHLRHMLDGLLQQHANYIGADSVDLRAIIVDTQSKDIHSRKILQALIDKSNEQYATSASGIHLLFDPLMESIIRNRKSERCTPMGLKRAIALENEDKPNPLYGYEETDMLLKYMMDHWRNRYSGKILRCDWITFTNGDNTYNNAWFSTVASVLSKADRMRETSPLQMVAWNFVTHHSRNTSSGKFMPNQPILTDLDRRGFMDLSTFIVKSDLIQKTGAKFLPHSLLTKDVFARDYFFAKQLRGGLDHTDNAGQNGTLYIKQTLLFHQ